MVPGLCIGPRNRALYNSLAIKPTKHTTSSSGKPFCLAREDISIDLRIERERERTVRPSWGYEKKLKED